MKAFLPFRKKADSGNQAFSLVEVVLALGVASFGLISMLGLLTVGLSTFHDAISETTETEIAQQMANQLQLADYSVLATNPGSVSYFTEEGVATNSSAAVYYASISAPNNLAVAGRTVSSTNTLTFIISMWSKSSPQTTNAIPIQIANNGL